jgi:hypothetical protein|tara:strand:+ start:1636 stop:2361 length:726 start_codon:yes stop_codon:yes gene_type:complete
MGEHKDKPILYHLPEIPDWIATGKRIYIPEGELKADLIISKGGAATTSPFGAGRNKWRAEYSKVLTGAEVIVLPDNDKPGYDFAQDKAASLYGIAKSVKVLDLPGPEKGDVIDWFDAGGMFEQLERLANEAPEWKPALEEELGGLLADVERFISLYVSTGGVERTALALWVAHTHASLMLKQGVHPKIVQERLGHSTIAITLDTYSHVTPGLQEAAANRFDDIVSPKPVAEPRKEAVENYY